MNTTTLILKASPLPTGLAAGVAGSLIGEMLLGATNSSAQTTDVDAPAPETNNTTEDFGSAGILLTLLPLAAAQLLLSFPRQPALRSSLL